MRPPLSPVCLITGSGKQRVGASVARLCAAKGYKVALHYRSSETEAKAFVDELRSQGVDADSFQANLQDESAVKTMVERVIERFGHLTLVVNCASTWLKRSLLETTAADVLDEFSTNALGTFLVSKYAGLRMVEQSEGGHIVTLSDWAIERPYRDHSAYFLSKGGIPTLTRVLAVELSALNPNVRVNCIAPGPVLLPDHIGENERAEISNATLVKKLGTPEHIAQAVLMLTENSFVTGTVLPVDGGRSLYSPE